MSKILCAHLSITDEQMEALRAAGFADGLNTMADAGRPGAMFAQIWDGEASVILLPFDYAKRIEAIMQEVKRGSN